MSARTKAEPESAAGAKRRPNIAFALGFAGDLLQFARGVDARLVWQGLRQNPARFLESIGAKSPRGVHAAVREAIDGLVTTAGEISRDTEPEFLQLAEVLKDLYHSASALIREAGERIQSIGEQLREVNLGGPGGIAAKALDQLREGLREVASTLESLDQVGRALEALHQRGAEMGQISRALHVAAYGFAVESSRNAEGAAAFGDFVVDLRSLTDQIAKLGEGIEDEARGTRSDLEHAGAGVSRGLAAVERATRQSDSKVRRWSGEIQELLDVSSAALASAESRSKKIAGHVNDAVEYLQYGDIIRQKMEHVESGFAEAAQLFLNRGRETISRETLSHVAARADRTLAIQVGQLRLMRNEALAARDRLSAAFSGISAESDGLANSVRQLQRPENDRTPQRNLFDDLQAEMRTLQDLESQGRDLSLKARAMASQSVNAASGLATHLDEVHSINRQMHHQALNAIIMATILGEKGHTLSLLSEEIHTMFQNAGEVAVKTAEALQGVERHRVIFEGTELPERDSGELLRGMEAISGIYREFHRTIESALSLAALQHAGLETARGRLAMLADFASRMEALMAKAEAVRSILAPFKALAPAEPESADDSSRYTVASEREIARQLSGVSTHERDGEMAPVAASDDSGFGDNIDLF